MRQKSVGLERLRNAIVDDLDMHQFSKRTEITYRLLPCIEHFRLGTDYDYRKKSESYNRWWLKGKIHTCLQELKKEGRACVRGRTNAAKWYTTCSSYTPLGKNNCKTEVADDLYSDVPLACKDEQKRQWAPVAARLEKLLGKNDHERMDTWNRILFSCFMEAKPPAPNYQTWFNWKNERCLPQPHMRKYLKALCGHFCLSMPDFIQEAEEDIQTSLLQDNR